MKIDPKYAEVVDFGELSNMQTSVLYKGSKVSVSVVNTEFPYRHRHTHFEFYLVLSGTISHHINDRIETNMRGDAYLIRPDDEHMLKLPENTRAKHLHINITVDSALAKNIIDGYGPNLYDELLREKEPLRFHLDEYSLNKILEEVILVQNMPKSEFDTHCNLLMQNLFLEFFRQRSKKDTPFPPPAWLNEFLAKLNDPDVFTLKSEQLAQLTNYSYSRLSRLFKAYVGINLSSYLTIMKINYAKELLKTTDRTMLDISLTLNYNSVSSFNHNFKSLTGMSPKQFRNNIKSKN